MDAHRHPQAEQILRRLRQEQIAALYHFTSIENLPCIRDMQALCSKQLLQDRGQWPPLVPGGDTLSHNLDRYHDNWGMVSCSFTPRTPMAYRRKPKSHLCFFVVQIDVAAFRGVVFTDMNGTANDHRRAEGMAGIDLVHFDMINSFPHPWDKEGWVRYVQAEILVPPCIMLDYIKEVTFVSQASLQEAERLWGLSPHPPFRVDPSHFEDVPGSSVLNFPVLFEWLLTDESIDTSNARLPHTHKSHFIRLSEGVITALARCRVMTGTRASMEWNPGRHVTEYEFTNSNVFWYWHRFRLDHLPDGTCSATFYLNNIRWSTLEFELVSQRREML